MGQSSEATQKQIETMKAFRFGIEIETVGRDRSELASAVAAAFPGWTVERLGTGYDKHAATMPDGRQWIFMTDGSLSTSTSCEVVTPICTYADLDMIQDVVRAVRKAGARVDRSCGIHVHIGVEGFDTAGIVRLAKLVYQQEPLMFAALGVQASRRDRYTREVSEDFISRLSAAPPETGTGLAQAWYGPMVRPEYASTHHYHESRYRGLNIHSVFYRKTVEFRYFEATLHAGVVKSYLQLCLAIAAKAKLARSAVARKRSFVRASAKYDWRVFLLRLAMIGPEFKTARKHLLEKMPGCSAFKHGRSQAERAAAAKEPEPTV